MSETLGNMEKSGEWVEYSTEEKVVGKWIDGKPLYQKCYVYNTAIEVNTSAMIASQNELANKIVVSIDGYCIVNTTAYLPLNISNASTAIATRQNTNGIQLDNKWGTISYVLAIIRYIKTTD